MSKILIAAVPYDIEASHFNFSTADEWKRKADQNVNSFGQVVEEYSFDFVDGSDHAQRLFNVMDHTALMTGEYFDAIDTLNSDDSELLLHARGIGHKESQDISTVDDAEDALQDLNDRGWFIFEGSLKDYVQERVDQDGGLSTLPEETLEDYFDWDSYARDVETGGALHEVGRNRILVAD